MSGNASSRGQIARAFSFEVAGQGYIVRFVTSNMAASFGKDQFMFHRLSSPEIPVPSIIYTGTFNDFHFAISRRVPGRPVIFKSPVFRELPA